MLAKKKHSFNAVWSLCLILLYSSVAQIISQKDEHCWVGELNSLRGMWDLTKKKQNQKKIIYIFLFFFYIKSQKSFIDLAHLKF